jgi:hypothetical protein
VEYLKGTANASAGAVQVICCNLARVSGPVLATALREAVRPLPEHRTEDQQAKDTDAFGSSLKVAVGIGLVQADSDSAWSLDPAIAEGLKAAGRNGTGSWFRAELLRRINAEAMASLSNQKKAADLVLGMTWLLQQDVLKPLGSPFANGAEKTIAELALADGTLVHAVDTQEQWRSFLRWIFALGLARNVDVPGARVVVADASTAIADALGQLPATERAADWLAELRRHLPIFGERSLLAALPTPRAGWHDIPPAVSLGLLKLEKRGVLAMEPADDGRGVVTIGLRGAVRQVGVIRQTGAAA